MRILITGASGSGTTTLGQALAAKLDFAFFDLDNYYWLKTDPPFQNKRDAKERQSLLLGDLAKVSSAVLSGSLVNWGEELEDSFSFIVFLTLEASIRVERLRKRELIVLGRVDEEFLIWAAQYDEGKLSGRSRAKHEDWLSKRSCKIIRIDGDLSVEERIERFLTEMNGIGASL